MVESRGDAVYLRDLTGVNETVPTAISVASGLNSSYSATYYTWVKVIDIGSSKAIYVPPTVYVPQVIAYSDKVSAPWYAPAGTGRGTIGGAKDPTCQELIATVVSAPSYPFHNFQSLSARASQNSLYLAVKTGSHKLTWHSLCLGKKVSVATVRAFNDSRRVAQVVLQAMYLRPC